jgi:two-component system, response regulator PdtaR
MRVLIAEDETIIRLDLKALLERAGHVVVAEARDGDEAVSLAERLRPDLVVMDVKMPRLDGIEAARRIVASRPVPVVMLTAYASTDLIDRATGAGAFGYLMKPFREADLVPAIATAHARFVELEALRAEAASLTEALATRKVLERAKGILMARDQLTEEAAFARIRRASQISGRPMRVIAEALLATFDEGSL